jgi:hypothetical protein
VHEETTYSDIDAIIGKDESSVGGGKLGGRHCDCVWSCLRLEGSQRERVRLSKNNLSQGRRSVSILESVGGISLFVRQDLCHVEKVALA